MGEIKLYEELDIDERREYWVKYIANLYEFLLQTHNLKHYQINAIYDEISRVKSLLSLFDTTQDSIVRTTHPSIINSKPEFIQDEWEDPEVKVYTYQYDSSKEEFVLTNESRSKKTRKTKSSNR